MIVGDKLLKYDPEEYRINRWFWRMRWSIRKIEFMAKIGKLGEEFTVEEARGERKHEQNGCWRMTSQ